jgi:hypothetical protein
MTDLTTQGGMQPPKVTVSKKPAPSKVTIAVVTGGALAIFLLHAVVAAAAAAADAAADAADAAVVC